MRTGPACDMQAGPFSFVHGGRRIRIAAKGPLTE
jgi:hypothetical protein